MERERVPTPRGNLNVPLSQLRHALAADDYGSFRQAAEVLSIKQSTLSRSVQLLERRFGATIFERSSGGVRATLTGRHFLRMARSILEQLDALAAITQAAGRGEAGRLAIGFCTSLTTGNLRASLLDFRQRFPQIEVVVVERRRASLATALRNGVLDVLIIIGKLPVLNGSIKSLWNERVFALLPAEHNLATREVVYWTDLRNETIILSQYDPGQEIEDLLVSKLVSPSERPKIERHDVSRGALKSLVTMKAGISIVLESDIGANFSGLVYRELRDGSGPSVLSYSAYWQNDNENPALKTFLELLCERYPSRSPML
ncbi:LysR family transcriptional regulator [Bradyrhizobium sp. CCGB12]|uniref:LysR substrate-binding domain-containing protein n=1 Tax=Bradyrhizobium sp. CCGB12 TaxID=2949632 RepID=UPI0020B1E619|nr:LysR family transcriptional regulator [Bradyrhizobium sp. CCGB12]MCP3387753.1 LysR family transcriptional regulator [Bradyrhizobium sp. CCGB12]